MVLLNGLLERAGLHSVAAATRTPSNSSSFTPDSMGNAEGTDEARDAPGLQCVAVISFVCVFLVLLDVPSSHVSNKSS